MVLCRASRWSIDHCSFYFKKPLADKRIFTMGIKLNRTNRQYSKGAEEYKLEWNLVLKSSNVMFIWKSFRMMHANHFSTFNRFKYQSLLTTVIKLCQTWYSSLGFQLKYLLSLIQLELSSCQLFCHQREVISSKNGILSFFTQFLMIPDRGKAFVMIPFKKELL